MPIMTSIMDMGRYKDELETAAQRRRMMAQQMAATSARTELARAADQRAQQLFDFDLESRRTRGYGLKDVDPVDAWKARNIALPESRHGMRLRDRTAAHGMGLKDQALQHSVGMDLARMRDIELPESRATVGATDALGRQRDAAAGLYGAQQETEDVLRTPKLGKARAQEAEAGARAGQEAVKLVREYLVQEGIPVKLADEAAKRAAERSKAESEAYTAGVDAAWAQEMAALDREIKVGTAERDWLKTEAETAGFRGQEGRARDLHPLKRQYQEHLNRLKRYETADERQQYLTSKAELEEFLALAPTREEEARLKMAESQEALAALQGQQQIRRISAWLYGGEQAGTADAPGGRTTGRPSPIRVDAAFSMIRTSPFIGPDEKQAALATLEAMLKGKEVDRGKFGKLADKETLEGKTPILGFEGGPEHGLWTFEEGQPETPGGPSTTGIMVPMKTRGVQGMPGQGMPGTQPTRVEDIMAQGQGVADAARGRGAGARQQQLQEGQIYEGWTPPGDPPPGFRWQRANTPRSPGWRLIRDLDFMGAPQEPMGWRQMRTQFEQGPSWP